MMRQYPNGWVRKKNLSLKKDHIERTFDKFWLLNTDISPLPCPHSQTLPQRRYVYQPNNRVKGNRPVQIGNELSTVGLSCRRPLYGLSEPPWNPPLSMRLVPFSVNKNSFTAGQVNDLLKNKDLPFYGELVVNTLDSNYSSPEYIVPTHAHSKLVNIIRIPSNRNVWRQLTTAQIKEKRDGNGDNRGANSVYGEKFKLSKITEWGKDNRQHVLTYGKVLANGRKVLVRVEIWEDMMIRSKRGHSMKDKPFRLVRVRLLNPETEEPIFKKSMWLGVWGKERKELDAEEISWAYCNRYDIEHFFRFGKQRLLLDKFQTPDEEHLQNWMEVVSLAYWLLFVGKDEVKHKCRKWQQYDKNHKNRIKYHLNVSPSQVQMQMEGIILGFEQTDFLPKAKIKGKGRAKGHKCPKRKRYPVLKKGKKKKKYSKKKE